MQKQGQYSPIEARRGSQQNGPENYFLRNERFPVNGNSPILWNQSAQDMTQMLQMSPMESNPSPGRETDLVSATLNGDI